MLHQVLAFPRPKCPEVLVADSSPIIRYGIRCLLKNHFATSSVKEAETAREVLKHYRNGAAGILIVDLNLPDADPQMLIQSLLVHQPGLAILVLSISKEELFGPLYLRLGAKGFVSKRSSETEILKAIEVIAQGKRYVREDMQQHYLSRSQQSSPYEQLTNREREVLKCLAQGESVTNIGKRTNNAVNTVSTHKANIFKKLHLSNLMELKKLVDSYPIEY